MHGQPRRDFEWNRFNYYVLCKHLEKYAEWLMDLWSYRSVMVTDGSIELLYWWLVFFVISFFTEASHVFIEWLYGNNGGVLLGACNISYFVEFSCHRSYWFATIYLCKFDLIFNFVSFMMECPLIVLIEIHDFRLKTHSIWPEIDIRLEFDRLQA